MYKILSEEFKTKKEMEQYISNLIKSLGFCEITKEHEQFKFFKSMIKNHPYYKEIKGEGIKSFMINRNKLNLSSFHLTVKTKDGKENDYSYRKCCQKKYSKDEYLIRVMRASIYPQIKEYLKQNKKKKCNICKIENIDKTFHVDHVIPFHKIKDDYLKLCDNKPTQFKNGKNGSKIFLEEDTEFKINWNKYHEKNATYQILCDKCNYKKSNKLEYNSVRA